MIADAIRAHRGVVAAAVGLAVLALLVGGHQPSARAADEEPGLDMPPIACTAEQRYASARTARIDAATAVLLGLAERELRRVAVQLARWDEDRRLEELDRWLRERCAREHEGGYLHSPAC